MAKKQPAAAPFVLPARRLVDHYDAISLAIEEQRSIARMFSSIFSICRDLSVSSDGDPNQTDGLWEGLAIVAARGDGELETILNDARALFAALPKGGDR